MVKLLVLVPHKEYVILRKAIKDHKCHECEGVIERGMRYIEDHINYARRKRSGDGFLWRVTNKVCLQCWKGPIPQ